MAKNDATRYALRARISQQGNMTASTTVAETEQAPQPVILPGLTPLQSAFVLAMASGEFESASAAARHAGYAPNHAPSAACDNMRNPAILEAISAHTLQRIAEHAPRALSSMAWLASKAKSEMVRQVASKDILDRAGFKPPDRHMIGVGGSVEIKLDLSE